MKINFFLPGIPTDPVGGYKVVYQYANALSKKGNQVSIIHVDNINLDGYSVKREHSSVFKKISLKKLYNKVILLRKKIAVNMGILKGSKAIKWFNFENNVQIINLWDFNLSSIESADVNIATAWNTAILLQNIPGNYGEKFYFIQGYENWQDTSIVDSTFKFKMHKIVVANWLHDMLHDKFNENSDIVPNFLDFNDYYLTNEIKLRSNNTVSMLYHESSTKGTEYGLKAIQIVKNKYPDTNVIIFGVYNKPKNLPSYIKYYKKPEISLLRDQIYNKSSIFISSSILEGWGLTVSEAMACGNAIVASDSKGINDFTSNNINSLIVGIKDPIGLADKIEYLLNNNDQRIKIAENGQNTILKFTLDSSVEILGNVLRRY